MRNRVVAALVVAFGVGVPPLSGWLYGLATPQAPLIVELELAGTAPRAATLVPADLRPGYAASLVPDTLLIIGYAVPAALLCAYGALTLAAPALRTLGWAGVVLLGVVAGLDVLENTLLGLWLTDPTATGVWPWATVAATVKFCLALPAALIALGMAVVVLVRLGRPRR